MTATIEQTTTSWADVVEAARRAARQQARGWPGIDKDDVTQEATVTYFREFGDGPGPESLGAWMRRTVTNAFVDEHRRRRGRGAGAGPLREKPLDFDALDREFDRVATSPSMRTIGSEVFERILAKLDGRDLEVFQARMQGMPAASVAARLSITPAAVDQAYARAKRRLRGEIEADPELVADLRDGLAQHALSPRF